MSCSAEHIADLEGDATGVLQGSSEIVAAGPTGKRNFAQSNAGAWSIAGFSAGSSPPKIAKIGTGIPIPVLNNDSIFLGGSEIGWNVPKVGGIQTTNSVSAESGDGAELLFLKT